MPNPVAPSRTREWETAIARGAVYALLTRAFSSPSTPASPALSGPASLFDDLDSDDPVLQGLIGQVRQHLGRPLVDLQAEHQELFTHVDPQDCPPYESAYRSSDIFAQTEVMADTAAFYHAHGLRVGGTRRERPDHIATQLEFMAFMATKEAYALEAFGPAEIDECRRTQTRFLSDHLGCWGPQLGHRIALVAPHAGQRAAGQLLERWLEAELEAYDLEPEARLDRPCPRSAPVDDTCALDSPPATVTPVEIRRSRP